ncbi:carbon-nitrogen family hydrolase [Halalkalibacillus halophilus]|uniref:carbon-nitrogen family hydrolase n=1 Tax=Halalkalibacillus halophilus TaxID=392827 RepID=UPI0004004896|nr:carbon-nitrogen family hydrolase [Halalkalibacillus halophilus]
MNFSIFQMDIVPGDPQANRTNVNQWIHKEMMHNSPDTIVLPEMWTTAYTLSDLERIADQDGEPTMPFIQNLASKYQVNIIAGSIANKKSDGIFNTAFVVDRQGEIVYQYDKAHLVPMLNEPSYLEGGKKPAEVFELDGLKFGLIVCYDLRFPELIRPLAVAGAQVLCIVAEWPEARTNHWQHLQIARAIENQMYVVSSNRIGTYDGTEFCGKSMIVNPWGEVLKLGSQDQEEVLSLTIELEKVDEVRKNVPIFDSRVPHLYKHD